MYNIVLETLKSSLSLYQEGSIDLAKHEIDLNSIYGDDHDAILKILASHEADKSTINIMLASLVACYCAQIASYGEQCDAAWDEALHSNEANPVLQILSKEGIQTIVANIGALLLEKPELQKINDEQFRLFMQFLNKLARACDENNVVIPYGKYEFNCLLDLYEVHYQIAQSNIQYEHNIRSFGQRLENIVEKNNTACGKNDYKMLLAIVHEFKEHGLSLDADSRFNIAVAANKDSFAKLLAFLAQKNLDTLLDTLNNQPSLTDEVREALAVIGAIKSIDNADEATIQGGIVEYEDYIARQSELFLRYFHDIERKSLLESGKEFLSYGVVLARLSAHQAFVSCKYLLFSVDLSLIILSLIAGYSVFVANSMLILAISILALVAFISESCYQGCYNNRDFVVGDDCEIIYDDDLKSSNHSGLTIVVKLDDSFAAKDLNPYDVVNIDSNSNSVV